MRLISLLFATVLWLGFGTAAAATSWQHTAVQVKSALAAASDAYAQGDLTAAKRAVLHAYFGVFESSKMEAAMRTTLGTRHTYQVESQFGQLRKAIKQHQPHHAIAERIATLNAALTEAAGELDKAKVPAHVFEVNQ